MVDVAGVVVEVSKVDKDVELDKEVEEEEIGGQG